MDVDLGQMLMLCLVMLEHAAADVSLLEGTSVGPAQLETALADVSAQAEENFAPADVTAMTAQIEQQTAGMSPEDRQEGIIFCTENTPSL